MIYEYELVIVVLFSFILGAQGAKSSIAVHLCYGVCSGGNKS